MDLLPKRNAAPEAKKHAKSKDKRIMDGDW